ncbi:amidohydrolase [Actinobaculum suis]|uniref:amidohydrolase n=1 Tax=Actinobaculum suis TaxID=1657 RepID=UPI0008087D62|nr:amidohydrolase [Actinobaculum suis]OCA93072.1 amidohydrolase [Actinobaculum suis]OCA93504.1 amidohydrolase [Actinobaculum suis]
MGVLPEEIRLTPAQEQEAIAVQKHLHANPELSQQEHETAKYLREQFLAIPLPAGVERQVTTAANTGFGVSFRNGEGPVVGFRADMDGLPVRELTGLPYASQRTQVSAEDGEESPVMHACGHDSHMAAALGIARQLLAHPDLWQGTVVFILQEAEEIGQGAKAMLADGFWDRLPHPEVLYGAHVIPRPAGTISMYPGGVTTATDGFSITVRGKSGHGSAPHTSIDPIVIGASIVMRLQTIAARETDPDRMAVVTVGSFRAGNRWNVIPAEAELKITTRSRDAETRQIIFDAVHRIARAEAAAAGAPEPEIKVLTRVPATENDPGETNRLAQLFAAEFGEENMVPEPFGFSEDFSEFARYLDIPYVFWLYGGFSEAQMNRPGGPVANHSPYFYADPELSLPTAIHAGLVAILSRLGK